MYETNSARNFIVELISDSYYFKDKRGRKTDKKVTKTNTQIQRNGVRSLYFHSPFSLHLAQISSTNCSKILEPLGTR